MNYTKGQSMHGREIQKNCLGFYLNLSSPEHKALKWAISQPREKQLSHMQFIFIYACQTNNALAKLHMHACFISCILILACFTIYLMHDHFICKHNQLCDSSLNTEDVLVFLHIPQAARCLSLAQ